MSGGIIIEAVIALGLLAVFLTSIHTASSSLQTSYLIYSSRKLARQLAEESLAVNSLDTEKLAKFFQNETQTENLVLKESATPLTPCLTKLSAWASPQNRAEAAEVQTAQIVLRPREMEMLGFDCSGREVENISDWQLRKFDAPDILSLNVTGLDILEWNGQTLAFVATTSPDAADLWIFQIENENVRLLSSLEMGQGLNALDAAVIDKQIRVFAARHDASRQLAVVDATETNIPTVISLQTLPGVGNSYPEGWSVKFHDGKIYFGVRETAGNELHVFDATSFSSLAKKEINHNVHNIQITKDHIILATSADREEIIILENDISLRQTSAINIAATRTGEGDAWTSSLLGNRLLVGRKDIRKDEPALTLIGLDNTQNTSEIKLDLNGANSKITSVHLLGNHWLAASNSTNIFLGIVTDKNELVLTKTLELPLALTATDPMKAGFVGISTTGQFFSIMPIEK